MSTAPTSADLATEATAPDPISDLLAEARKGQPGGHAKLSGFKLTKPEADDLKKATKAIDANWAAVEARHNDVLNEEALALGNAVATDPAPKPDDVARLAQIRANGVDLERVRLEERRIFKAAAKVASAQLAGPTLAKVLGRMSAQAHSELQTELDRTDSAAASAGLAPEPSNVAMALARLINALEDRAGQLDAGLRPDRSPSVTLSAFTVEPIKI